MNDQPNPIPLVGRDDPAAHSGDLVAENVEALKSLFPSIVSDGKVDFVVLRQLLGDEVDDGEERYGLNWKGKKRARAFALTPSLGTLRPAKDGGVDWDQTQNIFIEGENLEVLKLLRKSYAGRVKLIYIDPPYNTGNDFVYPDDYRDSISNYELLTGQKSAEGVRLTSNKEATGRFHTDWLNMMYPRLLVAKELLSDDGILLVSLDDAEAASFTLLCRECFGDENHVTNFVRRRRMATGMRDSAVSPDHEYVIAISRDIEQLRVAGFARDPNDFPFEDEVGKYRSTDLTVGMGKSLRPNQYYAITNPRTGAEYWPSETRVWRFEPKTMAQQIDAKNIIWPDDPGNSGMSRPRFKTRWEQGEEVSNPISSWIARASADADPSRTLVSGLNEEGTKQVRELMGEQVFDYPKPLSLIQGLVRAMAGPNDLVLDFFAGSGTTGHAVMAQNAADGGSRRFILVQLPEPLSDKTKEQQTAVEFCDRLGRPHNIAELTKERLRRAGAKARASGSEKKVDFGFRVYKLATSNVKPWQPDPNDLEASLLDSVDNVLPGRSENDLLVELLLKTGIDLTLASQERIIADKTVHALGGGVLMVCLADIRQGDAETLGQGICDWRQELDPPRATTFYFKDSGFENAATKANLAAIIKQRLGKEGVEKLASI